MEKWQNSDDFLARWLEGNLTEEERAEFEASDEFEAYKKIADVSSNFTMPAFDTQSKFNELKKRKYKKQAPVFRIHSITKYAVAATFLIAAFVTSYILLIEGNPVVEYQTNVMEKESYILPDGSSVILNSGSTISYNEDTWEQERRVKLTGEGFFKVEKGISFVVETDQGSVTVLGTEFNVKSRLSVFGAACYSGKIRVTVDEVVKDLVPGNGIQFQKGELIEEHSVPISETPSWVSGITSLQRVPLSLALEELKLQFGINIQSETFSDSLLYTGSFPNDDPEAAIKLILDSFELEYTYNAQSKTLTINPN